jgi:AGCS family alanine or glycine:cation symporter
LSLIFDLFVNLLHLLNTLLRTVTSSLMQKVNDFYVMLDGYIGGHPLVCYFYFLAQELFFTIYLGFPQFRYFRHAIDVVKGNMITILMLADTSHFQALATALSGTVVQVILQG